ncbi:E3 ubiquitin-protein ligase SHPRH isoform X2 [Cylas formicarius]|uniref:E3 ubiquitin-protein ligase SHPRH isoform X2 n=1 Tax=Cylas formicarius TaxID=197179 RepID=UPI002958B6EF|nr:E3 ubiquitin-protein ligase SHPRH isoform X2 [Cylas formicarius]
MVRLLISGGDGSVVVGYFILLFFEIIFKMVRNKNSPKRMLALAGNCSLNIHNEFIPVIKKRKFSSAKNKRAARNYTVPSVEIASKQYYLGETKIGRSGDRFPDEFNGCSIEFERVENEIIERLIFHCGSRIVRVIPDTNLNFLKELLELNVFFVEPYSRDIEVYFKWYLKSLPLPKISPKMGRCVKCVFGLLFNTGCINSEEPKYQSSLSNIELDVLYSRLADRKVDLSNIYQQGMHLHHLRPKLRPYQEKAVRWMIYRETVADNFNGSLHPLLRKFTLQSGVVLYFDKYTGWVGKEPSLVNSSWSGGILADEMGLGKTVEVLACILLNPRLKGAFDGEKSSSDSKLIIKTQKPKSVQEESGASTSSTERAKLSEQLAKSTTYQTLHKLYTQSLSRYSTVGTRAKPEEPKVQCICGSSLDLSIVKCHECGKRQHRQCLGYSVHNSDPYMCPQCWLHQPLLESGATLIVTPRTLQKQWCTEIETHLKPRLKVLRYDGFAAATPIYPTELNKFDIVVTTYNVLQSELKLTEINKELNLRRPRKYWPGGSPLIRIKWWRLCIDEAQAVESTGCMVSAMAQKITAAHRWAVTGTPISKNLSDLYGLVDYLQMAPYNDHDAWRYALYDPYLNGDKDAMYDFLGKVLWRTSKRSVWDQMNIPHQTYELHALEFSAVEKFFYNSEHELSAKTFLNIAGRFNPDLLLDKMDRQDMNNLLAPLLALRQACSDPSAVSGKGRHLALKRTCTSMKELLDALISKNKSECEDRLRALISAINGLAGVYLLMQKPENAIREYRKVLQLASEMSGEEKKGKLTIDKLPLIHAMHNLAEVLEAHPPTSEHTLRDDTLRRDCADLEQRYIDKFVSECASARSSVAAITGNIVKTQEQFLLEEGQWFSRGLVWVQANDLEDDLLNRIEAAAENANVDGKLVGRSPMMLLVNADRWRQDIDQLRASAFDAVNSLYYEGDSPGSMVISADIVTQAMNCHLRPQKQSKTSKKCKLCLANCRLKDYEVRLFHMKKRVEMFIDMGLTGSWKPTVEELLLKSLLALLKTKNGRPELIADGEMDVALFDLFKKEFKEVRRFWTLLDQLVCAYDELDICKVRMQMKTEDAFPGGRFNIEPNRILKNLSYEPAVAHENINLIYESQLPMQEESLRSDEMYNSEQLNQLLGTRNYLETLKKQQYEGQSPDPCPVCKGALEKNWTILTCGHCYCLDCFKRLLERF